MSHHVGCNVDRNVQAGIRKELTADRQNIPHISSGIWFQLVHQGPDGVLANLGLQHSPIPCFFPASNFQVQNFYLELFARFFQSRIEKQNASKEKQESFTKLFKSAKEALENGYTQEEIQIIVVTAFQVSTNPDLNQLWSILTGTIEINPDDDYQ